MIMNPKKYKILSKLIALTFAFNTITPVAFANSILADEPLTNVEETASTTQTQTATETGINLNGGSSTPINISTSEYLK